MLVMFLAAGLLVWVGIAIVASFRAERRHRATVSAAVARYRQGVVE